MHTTPDVLGIRLKAVPPIRLVQKRKLGGKENINALVLARVFNPFTNNVLGVSLDTHQSC